MVVNSLRLYEMNVTNKTMNKILFTRKNYTYIILDELVHCSTIDEE